MITKFNKSKERNCKQKKIELKKLLKIQSEGQKHYKMLIIMKVSVTRSNICLINYLMK